MDRSKAQIVASCTQLFPRCFRRPDDKIVKYWWAEFNNYLSHADNSRRNYRDHYPHYRRLFDEDAWIAQEAMLLKGLESALAVSTNALENEVQEAMDGVEKGVNDLLAHAEKLDEFIYLNGH
jgi:hypothetical protein